MSKISGKSKSLNNRFGTRRKSEGKELAPRSIRNNLGKRFMSECSDEILKRAGVKD